MRDIATILGGHWINIILGVEIILTAMFRKLEVTLDVHLGALCTFVGNRINKFALAVTTMHSTQLRDRSTAAISLGMGGIKIHPSPSERQ